MTHQLIAIVFLLAGIACAQIDHGPLDIVRRLRIRVMFGDHAACDSSIRVSLVSNTGFELVESSLNGECTAEFDDVPSGSYHMSVRGRDATNADDGRVEISPVMLQEVQVRARHTTQGSDLTRGIEGAAFVSVKDLQMPRDAATEFDKAEHLIEKQDWDKAYRHLRKGLADYSQFAAGYNNLGAVYVHLGKLPEAEETLQKAIALDNRLGPAYVNLARLRFLQKDYPGAEAYLDKALEVAPVQDAAELRLLAYAELSDGHLSQAIATSSRGHAMQLKQHSYLHLVAARAYERQGRIKDSASELRVYLNEEPSGAETEKVRSAIATLEAQLAAN